MDKGTVVRKGDLSMALFFIGGGEGSRQRVIGEGNRQTKRGWVHEYMITA